MSRPLPGKRSSQRTPPGVRAIYVYLLLLVCLAVTVVTTYVLYTNTQRLFRWSLEEKLRSIASVAALQFSPADLDQIRSHDD